MPVRSASALMVLGPPSCKRTATTNRCCCRDASAQILCCLPGPRGMNLTVAFSPKISGVGVYERGTNDGALSCGSSLNVASKRSSDHDSVMFAC